VVVEVACALPVCWVDPDAGAWRIGVQVGGVTGHGFSACLRVGPLFVSKFSITAIGCVLTYS
jgi:hypothetical protein